MKRRSVNPPRAEALYDRLHFSQATRAGDMIWVSGQVGVDTTSMTPADGMDAQARLAFEGVRTVLEAAGASLDDIVELTTFHTDLRGDMPEFSRVKDEYINGPYPSWTAVGVTQLALSELLVEIRAVAVAGSGADSRTGAHVHTDY
ncbi:RidA family protein [Streptomyces sp. NPDC018045]|uniref:RidA family protein n=1 Tax=Streptomyces sp. NPDC018045 TaxID=3365037 RepID=UPI00379F27B3